MSGWLRPSSTIARSRTSRDISSAPVVAIGSVQATAADEQTDDQWHWIPGAPLYTLTVGGP